MNRPPAGAAVPAPRARIDHDALRHNLAQVRARAPGSRIWAMLKANAYGHGLLNVAQSLDADGFAVARIQEAALLREAGVQRPILLLEGAADEPRLHQALDLDCQLVVHDPSQVALLEQARLPRPLATWLKVDTGMHRLGLPLDQVSDAFQRLAACPNCAGRPSLMTHLARADELDHPFTDLQTRRLLELPEAPGTCLSIANSAGLLAWPATRSHWVRPGIMLYGVSPFAGETGLDRGLRPVMTLEANLIAIHECAAGEAIGYGGTYICPETLRVGVAGIGYGDGYPRHAPNGTPVLVRGRRVPLIGRVSMDLITLDLRGVPDAQLGDPVTLWGAGLPVEEVAQAAGTIGYELLCGVAARVNQQHFNGEPRP